MLLEQIRSFIARSSGLSEGSHEPGSAEILQSIDGKSIRIKESELDGVLMRTDIDGQDFIQVNFQSGQKILMTDALIGFKPTVLTGLDMSRIPRVVTTPDIISVFEAIQEALHSGEQPKEVNLLRRVFESVLSGGEAIGFDLTKERAWLGRIPTSVVKVSA